MNMSNNDDDIKVSPELLLEYSELTMTEIILEIQDLAKALETERKAHAADAFARNKAEERVAMLEEQINTVMTVLQGIPKQED